MKRLALAGLVVVVLVIGVWLVLVGGGTAVPDVKGKTVAQATDVLAAASFKLGAVTYDEKSTDTTGSVIAQMPAAGTKAEGGSAVSLTVAGPAPVQVPELLGLDKTNAETALTGAGLALGAVIEAYDASATAGTVASQTPVPGVEAAKGSAVAVVMSKGPEPVAVPNVVGKTLVQAKELLVASGFSVSSASKDGPKPKNTVTAQSPKAGAKAQPGSAVKLTVATGLVKVPDVLRIFGAAFRGPIYDVIETADRGSANAKAACVRLGLKFQLVIGDLDAKYSQSPRAGSRVSPGVTVHLRIPQLN